MKSIPIDQYWETLSKIESNSEKVVKSQILEWEKIYKNLMEASLLILNYANKEKESDQRKLPLIFMKTTLSQFRSLWRLVGMGYSSAAACVAASIFESAKVVRVISVSEKDLNTLFSSETMSVPWSAKQLCKKVAKIDVSNENEEISKKLEEEYWQVSYLNYKWLCQIKHPTSQYAVHDLSCAISEQGFHLLPLPNSSDFDLSEKYKILSTAASDIWSMCKTVCEEYGVFCEDNWNAKKVDDLLSSSYKDVLSVMDSLDRSGYGAIKVFNRSFMTSDFSESKKKFDKTV